jgi:DNA mismatch endonuclease (patch repair protein)
MDTLDPAQRSERMSRVRGANTKPELLVRRLVHGMGYRYRLHGKSLPGRPDLVFAGRRAVIFIHGCFWHQHPNPDCKLSRLPKSRREFWEPKLRANRNRDIEVEQRLNESGWSVLSLWECELRDRQSVAEKVKGFLG